MSDYNPGDVLVQTFTLTASSGSLDLSNIFLSANIYESIFTPGIVGEFEILDTEDYVGQLHLSGGESIVFTFAPPSENYITYNFSLNSIDEVETLGSMKAKVFKLCCVSTEALAARTNHVQKSYNTQISNMIPDIFSNFLKSGKKINVEETQGIQRHVSPNIKPYALIEELRKNAVSLQNKSSNFMFFENAAGFNFVTIESMFKNGSVASFVQSDAVGSSWGPPVETNIISFQIIRQMNAIDQIGLGGAGGANVASYDVRTKTYKVDKVQPADFVTGGKKILSDMLKKQFGAKAGIFSFITDNTINPNSYASEGNPAKAAYLSQMLQNQVNVEVLGNTTLKAGACVDLTIPRRVATTGMNSTDPLINGQFLMAKVAHIIKRPQSRPRYVTSMECLKGGFDT